MIAHLHGMDNRVKLEWGWSCGCSGNSLLLKIDWDKKGHFSSGVFSRKDAQKLLKLLQTGLQQTNSGAIMVWNFEDAPAEYRNLSGHGGDEDWIGFVPEGFHGGQPMWMESGTAFGCSNVSEHIVPGGRIYIGAHA